jgi:hypothetical protein
VGGGGAVSIRDPLAAVLLGVDALTNPVRTGVHVLNPCASPPEIARWEEQVG